LFRGRIFHLAPTLQFNFAFQTISLKQNTKKFTSTDFRYAALFAADALKRHPALAKNRNEQPVCEGFM
jgi:hypothetical protein